MLNSASCFQRKGAESQRVGEKPPWKNGSVTKSMKAPADFRHKIKSAGE